MGILDWLFKATPNSSLPDQGRVEYLSATQAAVYFEGLRQAALVDGEHYSSYFGEVSQLKREKRHEEAISLLLRLVEATERESAFAEIYGRNMPVAPACYRELAIVYRKEGRIEDEIEILERYQEQVGGPGSGQVKLEERLEKARAIKAKQSKKNSDV